MTTGGVFLAAACGLFSAASTLKYASLIQIPSTSFKNTLSLRAAGAGLSADRPGPARAAIKTTVDSRQIDLNFECMVQLSYIRAVAGNRRTLFPATGGLLESSAKLQYAKIILITTNDLQPDRQSVAAEPARNREGRRTGDGDVVAGAHPVDIRVECDAFDPGRVRNVN